MKNQFINRAPGSERQNGRQEEASDPAAKKGKTAGSQGSLFKAPFSPHTSTPAMPAGNDQAYQTSAAQRQGSRVRPSSEGQHKPAEEFIETLAVEVPDYLHGEESTWESAASTPPAMRGIKIAAPTFQASTPPGFAPPAITVQPAQPVIQIPYTPEPPVRTPFTEQRRAAQWPQPVPGNPAQNMSWQNMQAPPVQPPQRYGMPYPLGPQARAEQRYTPPAVQPLPQPKKRGLPIWSRVLLGTLIVLLVLGGSAYAYYQANYASSISNITNQQVIHHNAQGAVVTVAPATTDVLTGNRLNILLLGSDTDGKSVPLAQTDIVITIDPQTKYVGMLSIPRDLRLYAPKAGAIKMDEAFSTGWSLPGDDHYGNAVGLSIDTIEQNFGIPINYSAWVGLDGFVQVINTAGGIDVNVLHPMVDDIYPNDVNNQGGQAYDYKRLYLAPGPQHLDGIQALEYVRTRHSDGAADFGRAVRQQQILSQLKNKLTQIDLNTLPTLIQDLNGHVKTDMQLTDIPKLLNFARGIDPNKIDKLVLSQPYSVAASSVFPKDTSTDYIPVCSQIVPKLQQMFDLGANAICPTVGARYSFPKTSGTNQTAVVAPARQGLMTTTAAWQMIGKRETIGAASLPVSIVQEKSSVHSLLDLMFMTVFQSFEAART